MNSSGTAVLHATRWLTMEAGTATCGADRFMTDSSCSRKPDAMDMRNWIFSGLSPARVSGFGRTQKHGFANSSLIMSALLATFSLKLRLAAAVWRAAILKTEFQAEIATLRASLICT